ncbi:unnamed protein product, partial [Phaeothamnion confervicola]
MLMFGASRGADAGKTRLEPEDDVYEDFNYCSPAQVPGAAVFGAPPGTAQRGIGGMPPGTAYRPPGTMSSGIGMSLGGNAGRSALMSQAGGVGGGMGIMGGGRLTTGQAPPGTALRTGAGDARPMTSVSGAGYQSKKLTPFDPLGEGRAGGSGGGVTLPDREDKGPEDQAKEMEKQVHKLLEASAEASVAGDHALALERAREADRREKALCRLREKHGLGEAINLDLTYSVCFNLASCLHAHGQIKEAMREYGAIVKNRQYPQAGRLRCNVGNICFEQGEYLEAIKNYRMALDQVPNAGKEVRFRIFRNIGTAFVRMGQYHDAIGPYETVMQGSPDLQTGFNLVMCYYALDDPGQMRKAFQRLVAVPAGGAGAGGGNAGAGGEGSETDDDDEDGGGVNSGSGGGTGGGDGGSLGLGGLGGTGGTSGSGGTDGAIAGGAGGDAAAAAAVVAALNGDMPDGLRTELRRRQDEAGRCVLTAAKLIAPALDRRDWEAGWDWVAEAAKADHPRVASQLEVEKALQFLKAKEFDKAVEHLKALEKKGRAPRAMAATNLSFIHFLEGDFRSADLYADLAVKNDRYNSKALVNKGNCLFVAKEYARAKELYLEAVGVEVSCVDAIFNLGLANIQLGLHGEALQAFEKLHTMLPDSAEVLYHIANLYETHRQASFLIQGTPAIDLRAAAKWFELLLARVPTDPGVLARLGRIAGKEDDESQAYHYHMESYRRYPANLDIISWLGVWYVKSELYEKAVQFFERAAQIQPGEVKWRLMVTSCFRRMGNFPRALELYEQVHAEYPENLECLRYLVALCKDLGRPHDHYQQKLVRLDRSGVGGG